jgi:uncharacterized protein YndB with AHSA1/START domain
MEAKDGGFGFDLSGAYEDIEPGGAVTLALIDGRWERTTFVRGDGRTQVTTVFEAKAQNPIEMRRDGWQAILENFQAFLEKTAPAA